jgi:type II secretory pathway pseudopilin PulG
MAIRVQYTRVRCDGFTYIGVLFAITILGVALAAAATVWSTAAKREREMELLFIGHEFRDAIASYYRSGPAGGLVYPRELSQLLSDDRDVIRKRHLRRIYVDPIMRSPDWELVTLADGAIIGVASRSLGVPMKVAGFDEADAGFEGAGCYCEWRFVFLPSLATDSGPSL